jgi:hypothetical protein
VLAHGREYAGDDLPENDRQADYDAGHETECDDRQHERQGEGAGE